MLQHGQSFVAVHNLDLIAIIFCVVLLMMLLLAFGVSKAYAAVRSRLSGTSQAAKHGKQQ